MIGKRAGLDDEVVGFKGVLLRFLPFFYHTLV